MPEVINACFGSIGFKDDIFFPKNCIPGGRVPFYTCNGKETVFILSCGTKIYPG
jgi:hypothetical protein